MGRSILVYGLPVAISGLIISGISQADRFIVGSVLGSTQLGIYGASYDIAEKTIFFFNAMLLLQP